MSIRQKTENAAFTGQKCSDHWTVKVAEAYQERTWLIHHREENRKILDQQTLSQEFQISHVVSDTPILLESWIVFLSSTSLGVTTDLCEAFMMIGTQLMCENRTSEISLCTTSSRDSSRSSCKAQMLHVCKVL